MSNAVEFRVWGRNALFTDPLTRIGGEKCSYHLPTYEALKGVAKSIYWKPTLTWIIDEARVVRVIQTRGKNIKPLTFSGGNTLSIYTYLAEVEYQVRAHFEWNTHRPELAHDRDAVKHMAMAIRSLAKGGRQDIFLGTRECQGYVEPCRFGEGSGHYDSVAELDYGVMFHGFDYPDETGRDELHARFWRPVMRGGIIRFPRPEECDMRRFVRPMTAKRFDDKRVRPVAAELAALPAEA